MRKTFHQIGSVQEKKQIPFTCKFDYILSDNVLDKHDSLYLHLSRILRPVWNISITSTPCGLYGNYGFQTPMLKNEERAIIEEKLHELQIFMDQNKEEILKVQLEQEDYEDGHSLRLGRVQNQRTEEKERFDEIIQQEHVNLSKSIIFYFLAFN